MRKLLPIGAWYCLFIFIIVVALFWIPDSWRVHPTLERPTIIVLDKKKVRTRYTSTTILFGDCAAYSAPYPFNRIALPAFAFKELFREQIENSNFQNCEVGVIMYGMSELCEGKTPDEVNTAIQRIVDVFALRYPTAIIHVISPYEIHEIAKTHPRDGVDAYHMSPTGYKILASRYDFLRMK